MRSRFVPALILLLCCASACSSDVSGTDQDGGAREALTRSLDWLERNPVDPETAALGNVGFDTWNWWLFSVWHPDTDVRARAGTEVDARLRAVRSPGQWNQVSLSYWAMLLRIARLRDIELTAQPPLPGGPELAELVGVATPTTAYWIEELLRHAGLPTKPDTSATLLARGPADPTNYNPTIADAYAVFHEIVPATGLGVEKLRLTEPQATFIRDTLPGWIGVSRAANDTDAVAEVLAVAAMLGEPSAAYDDALAWLLSRQNSDGTFVVTNASGNVDDYRHVVLVGSMALLTSLEGFDATKRD